jgi:hypothetical protein
LGRVGVWKNDVEDFQKAFFSNLPYLTHLPRLPTIKYDLSLHTLDELAQN